MKYSDLLADWLVELGYDVCFFLAGGNTMHIVESCSRRMRVVPVVHEVAAGIAAEYYNEVSGGGRAFALVTAGPGVTNLLTAVAGAWLESRELLVIGGQVKTADLRSEGLRQRGIQEIDGVALCRPITVRAERLDDVVDRAAFARLTQAGSVGRKGPVFVELPIDVQARSVDAAALSAAPVLAPAPPPQAPPGTAERLAARIARAERPVVLIGGGVSRATARAIDFAARGVPVMTTWNGLDRIGADDPVYGGRPNTWGQRAANLLMQQADLLVAFGSRLGMQQTGFNWREFVPLGEVVQVEIDRAELEKGHPRVDWAIEADANPLLADVYARDLGAHDAWLAFCRGTRAALPADDPANVTAAGYLSPYAFAGALSRLCGADDVVVPCSSGGAETTMMQAFEQRAGQTVVNDKGLASMGYGLSGAIGAAVAAPGRRVVLVEGDGGFAQQIQEVGTAAVNGLNLKIFIYDDSGYASIRMTQSNYFDGRYVGCDVATGVGLPRWERLFAVWDVPTLRLAEGFERDEAFLDAFARPGLRAFLVPIDPKQTYYPKIASRVTASGGMESNPLHRMSPELDPALEARVAPYLLAAPAR